VQLLTTFNNNLAIGNGNVSNVAIGSNGVNPSINGQGPMPTFNLVVEFF
jgi:hypothetical protein